MSRHLFISYFLPLALTLAAQGAGVGQMPVAGPSFAGFNAWDMMANNTAYAFNLLNPGPGQPTALLGMVESNNAAISPNAVHCQAANTNTSGTTPQLTGCMGEADVFGNISLAAGVEGVSETHAGIVGTWQAGGAFFSKVDAAQASAEIDGVHILSNVNNGSATTNCGLCVDNQAGIAGTSNYAIKTGTGLSSFGDFAAMTAQRLEVTGADVTCGTSGTLTPCTAFTTITGLSKALPTATATTWSFERDLVVSQATAAAADQIGVQTATNAPVNLLAEGFAYTAAGVSTAGAISGVSSTSVQSVVTFTPGATGTKLPIHLTGTIEGAFASGTTFNLQVLTGSAADLLTIYRGSACWLF